MKVFRCWNTNEVYISRVSLLKRIFINLCCMYEAVI